MKNLTRDELAKWLAVKLLNIDSYNFDMFYDIAKIIKESDAKRGSNTSEPVVDAYSLYLRPTGCDMVWEFDDSNLTRLYTERSTEIYKLKFTWNCDYLMNVDFCIVERINK